MVSVHPKVWCFKRRFQHRNPIGFGVFDIYDPTLGPNLEVGEGADGRRGGDSRRCRPLGPGVRSPFPPPPIQRDEASASDGSSGTPRVALQF